MGKVDLSKYEGGKTLINIRPLPIAGLSKEYDQIDFGDGVAIFYEDKGEDILTVEYPKGYSIDVGYIEEDKKYYVTVLRCENWNEPLKEYASDNRETMLSDLAKAIAHIVAILEEK